MVAQPQSATRQAAVKVVVALGLVLIAQALFALCLVSAEQLLVPRNMPFGVVGRPSEITAEVAAKEGLALASYPNAAAVTSAAEQGRLYGAFMTGARVDTLVLVPAKSFFAQTELEPAFLATAHKLGRPVTVRTVAPLPSRDPTGAVTSLLLLPLLIGGYLAAVLVYKAAHGVAAAPWRGAILVGYALVTPVPLAPKDPFGLVQALMLVPLLIGGYMSSTLLLSATGKAAGHWRAAQLAGFAIAGGLLVDLIVCYGLRGFPSGKFWIVWPICSLIIAVVAFVAAVLQKLFGPVGTVVTVVAMILVGNPSSGGASGVPHLPAFWRAIGPYLPPRNAYILLHHSIYFDGHGTSQALINLLIYLGAAGIVLIVLDRRRSEAAVPTDATEAAAMAIPIGAVP